jgi:uncharacterized protein YeaC (DUF1315 family)
MIVSTWEFLQKQVRGVSLGRAVKGVKLVAARKELALQATLAFACLRRVADLILYAGRGAL